MKLADSFGGGASARGRALGNLARSAMSRGGVLWNHPIALAGRRACHHGALDAVVHEAERRADLPAHIRFRMIRWASAVVGETDLPDGFRPAQHLGDPQVRAAALTALQDRVERRHDHRAREQIIQLDDRSTPQALLQIVGADLNEQLARRATRPKRGDGVDPERLMSIVADAVDRLEARGIRPFLMSGTLLGFVREGNFLDHDHDVDLGLLPDVDLRDVAAALGDSGLTLSTPVDRRWLVAVHESGLHLDFFHHELRDGLLWHCTEIHDWWNTPFQLESLAAGGRDWWIPENAERYLDENYGTWAEPVAFYDISFDTPNRRYRDTPQAIRHLYTTCARGLEADDRWMVESAARELRDQFGVDITKHLAPSGLLEVVEPADRTSST